MPDDDLTDEELRLVFAGDPEAMRRFVDVFAPVVRWAAAHKLRLRRGVRVSREDVENDIWERLLRRDRAVLRRFDRNRGPLSSFVRIVALQRASESLERHASTSRMDSVEVEEELVDHDPWMERDMRMDLERVLRHVNLSHRDSRLLGMIFFERRSAPEIASELGMSVNNIYQRKGRLLARIREAFEGAPVLVGGALLITLAQLATLLLLWTR